MITRLATVEDAGVLSVLQTAHREAFARWEPVRDDAWYTVDGQRAMLVDALEAYKAGTMVPLVITDGGEVAGRLTLNGVTRGALQSASIGYWVSPDRQGRGLAKAALAEAAQRAFDEMGLHRLQAETLLDNTASQRVLLRNGFRPYGVAPEYLRIAGRWQDHVLFHRLADH
jgi:[ribosomal protein S5]-alanine N-acetyltransferase